MPNQSILIVNLVTVLISRPISGKEEIYMMSVLVTHWCDVSAQEELRHSLA